MRQVCEPIVGLAVSALLAVVVGGCTKPVTTGACWVEGGATCSVNISAEQCGTRTFKQTDNVKEASDHCNALGYTRSAETTAAVQAHLKADEPVLWGRAAAPSPAASAPAAADVGVVVDAGVVDAGLPTVVAQPAAPPAP